MGVPYTWECIIHGSALYMGMPYTWEYLIHGSALYMAKDGTSVSKLEKLALTGVAQLVEHPAKRRVAGSIPGQDNPVAVSLPLFPSKNK